MSPTVLKIRNLRFVIYPKDHKPPHVHVFNPDGCEARFKIEDLECYYCKGFSKQAIGEIGRILGEWQSTVLEAWYEWNEE